jgi:hypothetical protein
MAEGGRVVAEVSDQQGPVERAVVYLDGGEGIPELWIRIENGAGSVAAVPAGVYQVLGTREFAVKDGPSVTRATLSVVAGQEHHVRLRLP